MHERLICCCGASGWSKVIGWFQTITSAVMLLRAGLEIGGLTYVTATDGPELLQNADPATVKAVESELTFVFALAVSSFIINLIGFIMGIVLLRGSYNTRPHLLRNWTIYAYIALVSQLLVLGASCTMTSDGAVLGTLLVFMLIVGLVQGFCIWVVGTHRVEMEENYDKLQPVKA